MRTVILQPSYLPWLGYFDLMSRADKFVFLDDVQFTRRDWRNRNKVRTRDGWCWLTVPVIQKDKFQQTLKEAKVDNTTGWRRKHLDAIRLNYSRSPYFDLYFPCFKSIYSKEWNYLLDICYETIFLLKDLLHITTPILKASELDASGSRMDKILGICRELGADRYLSGDAAKDYLSEDEFLKQGITLEYHGYRHPVYRQRFSGYQPYLSVIDLLFNSGEQSLEILKQRDLGCEKPEMHPA